MIFRSIRRLCVPRPSAPAAMNEHHAIKSIGRWLVASIAMLIIAASVMLGTALQVCSILGGDILADERQRAANAVDLLTTSGNRLDPGTIELIRQVAGLDNVHLSPTLPTDSREQALPLLGQVDGAVVYLVWTGSDFADRIYARFVPIRVPMMLIMLTILLAMILRVRGLVRDVERQRRLAHGQSRTDALTGLGNRLAFDTSMAARRAAATPFGLILFDLDHFKAVNDALGHAAGDGVLREIGQRLSAILGPGDQLARLGGDEFVMLCTSITGQAALSARARQAIAAIERPIDLAGRLVQVGASLGIVGADGDDLPDQTVLGAADAALYRAKAVAGSSFQFAGAMAGDPASVQLRYA